MSSHAGRDAAVPLGDAAISGVDSAVDVVEGSTDGGLLDAETEALDASTDLDASLPDPRTIPEVNIAPIAPTLRFPGHPFDEKVLGVASIATSLLIDDADRVWFSTNDAVYRVDGDDIATLATTELPGVQTSYYSPMLVRRSDGEVKLVSESGLLDWDGTTLSSLATWSGLDLYSSFHHLTYVDTTLWLLDDGGAATLVSGAFESAHLVLSDVARAGDDYYGASRNEVLHWDGLAWQTLYTGPAPERINSLAADAGRLYASTNTGVLVLTTDGAFVARHTLGKEMVQVLPGADGTLWALPIVGGVMHYDGSHWALDPRSGAAFHDMLARDSTGKLWLGTWKGLYADDESDIAQRIIHPTAELYPGTRYFTKASDACVSLLHGARISGNVLCETHAGRTYLFFGDALVTANGYATQRPPNRGGADPVRAIGARSKQGTVAIIDLDDGTGHAHVRSHGVWSDVSVPTQALLESGADERLLIDDAQGVWLRAGNPSKVYHRVGGAFHEVALPLPTHDLPYGEQSPYAEDEGSKYQWRTRGTLSEWSLSQTGYSLSLIDVAKQKVVLGATSADRLAVPSPGVFAADGLGNLWLLDTGGGVAVQARSYLLSGQAP